MNITPVLAAAALALVPLASAEAAEPESADAAQPKAKKICRDLGHKAGSRMSSGKRCKTAEEWAKIDGEKKDVAVQELQVGTINRAN